MMPEKPGLALVAPLMVGPVNCEPVLGVSWRWLRDHAGDLGLKVLRVEGKPFVEALAALEAIRRHGTPVTDEEPTDNSECVDELEAYRARLGKRRRAGG